MILAHEARKKAQEVVLRHNTDELIKIDKGIRKAASSGKFSYSYSGCISLIAMKELVMCGYNVRTDSQDRYVVIEWY